MIMASLPQPAHTVLRQQKPIALTPTEFRLLEHLLQHAGLVLSYQQLLTAVWGFAYSDASELLKPTISRLRQKIEDDPSHPQIIQTVYGVGYRLVWPAPPTASL
jgi:DNA-binding response OmpR family regulator